MKTKSNKVQQNKEGFSYQLKTFGFAIKGLLFFFKDGPKARIHSAAGIIVGLLGLFLKIKIIDWIILCLCVGFVFALEIVNTALEKLADYAEPKHNKTIGTVKDLSAAAVLVAALSSAIIGLIIFIPRIIEML